MRWLAGQLVTVVGQAVIVAVRVEKIVEVVNPPDPGSPGPCVLTAVEVMTDPLLLLPGVVVVLEEPVTVAEARVKEELETPED